VNSRELEIQLLERKLGLEKFVGCHLRRFGHVIRIPIETHVKRVLSNGE
jgi:hypothetical protein